jgi:hypothetical protein
MFHPINGEIMKTISGLPGLMDFDLTVKKQASQLTQKYIYPMLMTMSLGLVFE